ncbi:CPBP family intramembrane glutamic endopeptidase [Nocardioides alcanivorans]|uniref:CPBP family intramembrane glutamic endopeptidase n=1 Tax=Nocardioides alcanivorans TaxID=2897352 RepID=UPI001F1C52F1|nr:type II CAAX endopeptidase family protein [Nocardioides alcanivorans]
MTRPTGAPAYPHGRRGTPGLGYDGIHRLGTPGWWRPLVGVVLLLTLFYTAGAVLVLTIRLLRAGVDAARGGSFADAYDWVLLDTDQPMSPWGLAYLALSLAVLVPVTILIQRLLHGLSPGSLVSVVGRIRWTWFFACCGLAVVALLATIVVSAFVPSDDTAGSVSGSVAAVDERTWWFLAVIVLLIPFQAAGEEYAFRGYLTQVFGGWLGPAVAVLAPALLFALAHGAQDAPVFVDRLAFGIVAGILVLRTGGLEAAIAMHVLNNWFAFTLALAFGHMDDVLTPTGGSWWSLPVTLTQSLVYLAVVLWLGRRMSVRRHTEGAVLAAPRGHV